jgi:hypothetical protein
MIQENEEDEEEREGTYSVEYAKSGRATVCSISKCVPHVLCSVVDAIR